MSILASFWKPEACGQTVLPDRSVLTGQKLVESAKFEKFKYDILSNFQTMCRCYRTATGLHTVWKSPKMSHLYFHTKN